MTIFNLPWKIWKDQNPVIDKDMVAKDDRQEDCI